VQEVKELMELDQKLYPDSKKYFKFLMYELQKHLLEIDELYDEKDPHIQAEIADIAILARILALQQGVDEETFSKRFQRFKEKIQQEMERK